ncbi:hypothetical protein CFC21_004558 [Triticum aestivum]|uniref:Uncharacterized protein n=1 Tax=Triticum aestivum TaxID=4565 RepID=A0A3B5Y7J2_WHEAT|nr:hypothetical protein CFC21_004558 [Triticum aestivum]
MPPMAGEGNPGEGGGGEAGGGGGPTGRAPPTPPPAAPTSTHGRSGKEGHGMEADCPVPWYTRTLVALGIKSHGDPSGPLRHAFTLSQHSSGALKQGTVDPLLGVVVTSEGYLSRSEFERINNYLECVLNEVKSALGSSAEDVEDEYGCQDTVPPVTQESSSGPGLKTISAIVLGAASRNACESPQISQGTSVRGEIMPNNAEHVQVIQQSTQEIKAFIHDAVRRNLIAPDCARDLVFKIDELGKCTSRAVSRNGTRIFTLNGLKKRLKLPDFSSLSDKIIAFGGSFHSVITITGAAYRVSKSDGPGYFHDVGKEALELIRDPFYLQNHVWNSGRKSSLICGSEFTTSQKLVKKLMLSFKNDGSFMCFKASVIDPLEDVPVNDPEHDVAVNDIPDMEDLLVEKIVGPDVNTMLYLPYSLKKAKVEFQLHQPYDGSVLSIGLNNERMPCISVSSLCGLQDICLGGVDSLAFGGQLKINESKSWFSVSAGLSVRAELFSAGLTFKQPVQFDYTFCSNILNTSTVLGGLASYSYLTNQWKLIGGIGHTFDPTFNIKGRIGNDKTVNALISKKFAGKGSLHFASEVDLKDFWRYPRVGLSFSFP